MPTQQINGASTHYVDQGRGISLVFLHGFPFDSRMWDAQVEGLSSHHRIIAPDFRGFGKSTDDRPFTVPGMADDVAALLDAIDGKPDSRGALGPIVLAGLSMGGYVAMNFARRSPARLRGLILIDTKDPADNAEQHANRDRMIEVARTKGSPAIADLMLPKLVSPDTADHRPDKMKQLHGMMEQCPAKTIENALAALRDRPDMTEELPKITAPTLVIVGDADSITPPTVAEAMAKRIPKSQLTVIPSAGHMAPMEQATLVNRTIRQFVEKLETTR